MKRYLTWAVIGALVVWAASQAIHFYHITFPNRTHTMIDALEDMQTFCVGRFLIDLPRGTKITSVTGSGGPADFSAQTGVSKNRFGWLVNQRWEEISARTINPVGKKPFDEPSKRTDPIENGVLFAFDHATTRFTWNGETRDWPMHKTDAFLWRDEMLYRFDDNSDDQKIIDTMRMLQVLPDGVTPVEPGFCGPRSFFPGGYRPESVDVTFRLPVSQKMTLRIKTTTYPSVQNTPDEPPRPDATPLESEDFKSLVHRDTKRTVSGRDGLEWSVGSTQRKFQTFETYIFARWFTSGAPASAGYPAITADLGVVYEADEPPPSWGGFPPKSVPDDIDEEAFMTYWDTILDTLRPRPGAIPTGEK